MDENRKKKPVFIAPNNMAYGEFNSTVPFIAFADVMDGADPDDEMSYAELYGDDEEEDPRAR